MFEAFVVQRRSRFYLNTQNGSIFSFNHKIDFPLFSVSVLKEPIPFILYIILNEVWYLVKLNLTFICEISIYFLCFSILYFFRIVPACLIPLPPFFVVIALVTSPLSAKIDDSRGRTAPKAKAQKASAPNKQLETAKKATTAKKLADEKAKRVRAEIKKYEKELKKAKSVLSQAIKNETAARKKLMSVRGQINKKRTHKSPFFILIYTIIKHIILFYTCFLLYF